MTTNRFNCFAGDDCDEFVEDVYNLEHFVDGDGVRVAEGSMTAEGVAIALADGFVVPCDGLDMGAVRATCRALETAFETVTVTACRERLTGMESDAELFEHTFEALRETWIKRKPAQAARPKALAATGS